jgi:hypothetical protein
MRLCAVAGPATADDQLLMNPDQNPQAARAELPAGPASPPSRPAEPAAGAASAPADQLHVCVLCASPLVQPYDWAAEGPSHWRVMLRCPDCGALREGLFTQQAVDRLADELDRGSGVLIRALDRLTRENMAAELEVLVKAFEHDLILPSDF